MSGFSERDVLAMDANTLVRAYAERTCNPEDATELVLQAADRAAAHYSAITSLNHDDARRAAAASAQRWKLGRPLGPLDGVPMTFKDSFNIAGLPRWHGTAVNVGTVSTHDAAPVRRAREAGIVIIGKTSMPDYGLLMSGLSSRSGTVRNPWDPATNTAGSSAGAAACLAAGVGPLALGTDMVGSVRLPAALCGLVAMHATQGRVAYDPPGNYRGAGPMTRTVADAVALLKVVGQYDAADHFALPGRFDESDTVNNDRSRDGSDDVDRDSHAAGALAGLRIAVLPEISYGTRVDAATAAAVQQQSALLASLGATTVTLDDLDLTWDDYQAVYHVMVHKGLPELYAMPPARRGLILPEIGEMLDRALRQTALELGTIHKRIGAASAKLERQLASFDYLLSPALPVRAFPAEWISPDPAMGAMSHMGFSCWFNQLGRPAGTVPVMQDAAGGCPVSVQIAGRRFDDAGVLRLMRLLERHRGFDIDFPILSAARSERMSAAAQE